MSKSSFQPVGTATPRRTGFQAGADGDLADHFLELARQGNGPGRFSELLAEDLLARLRPSILILQVTGLSEPIVRGPDVALLTRIDADLLNVLISTATPTPISCSVPMRPEWATESPRSLRVELLSGPPRLAAVLIYARHHPASVLRQVEHLKQLRVYAESLRTIANEFPWNTADMTGNPGEAAAVQLRREENTARVAARVLSSFHDNLDPQETCYRIANESRRMLKSDRVSVLTARGNRYRVRSVSGVAVMDPRSNTIQAIEQFADAAMRLGKSLEIPSDVPLAPQLQEPLDQYLDDSGVSSARLIPLRRVIALSKDSESGEGSATDTAIVGALLLENFSGAPISVERETLESVVHQAAIALGNAQEHHSVFGLRWWKAIGRMVNTSSKPLGITCLALTALLLAFGFVWPVEHHVVATGKIEPVSRRDVFARVDGTVQQLHVRDGQRIAQGDLLIELENPELRSRAEAIAGQIQTVTSKLASIRSLRLSDSGDPSQTNRLAMEQRQLESELTNLRAQHEVLKLQLSDLHVMSPIEGIVIAWELERRLTGRPVDRGSRLCSVVRPDGTWELRLAVPENNAGPILEATANTDSPVVHFAMATHPERSYRARLVSVASSARVDEQGERVIDVSAIVDDPAGEATEMAYDPASLRVGADVTARIACGQRPLIQSWFSDLIDFVHRHLLFPLRS